jgi:hypothetical protein
MPTVEGLEADHHKYVVDGKIDPEVMQRQSRLQGEKLGETSVLHYHRHGEPCKNADGSPKKHEGYGFVERIDASRTLVNKA